MCRANHGLLERKTRRSIGCPQVSAGNTTLHNAQGAEDSIVSPLIFLSSPLCQLGEFCRIFLALKWGQDYFGVFVAFRYSCLLGSFALQGCGAELGPGFSKSSWRNSQMSSQWIGLKKHVWNLVKLGLCLIFSNHHFYLQRTRFWLQVSQLAEPARA